MPTPLTSSAPPVSSQCFSSDGALLLLEGAPVSDLAGTIGLISALLAVPTTLGALVFRPVSRFIRKFSQFLDDWTGEPERPGIAARKPGVMERLHRMEGDQADAAQIRTDVQAALIASEKRTSAVLADIDVNLAGAMQQIETMHKELTPNGGGSLKDQMSRVDRTLNAGGARSVAKDHDGGSE